MEIQSTIRIGRILALAFHITLNGELAFLFAVLQAEQAVEFFFGRLTAIDACVASMRGGPGASGKGLDLPWCPIFESDQ